MRVIVLLAAAAVLVFYAWTASSSGNPFNKPSTTQWQYQGTDYSNLQADAFLHGRLSLDVPVDPSLAGAANPYDPAVPGFRLPDASFYNDHYYLSWGPAPALVVFLPFRVLGLQLHENAGMALLAFIGMMFAWASLALLVRWLVPGTSRLVIWGGNATLALGGALPFILRRPVIYEMALTAAFCFTMAGFYLLLREVRRPQAPRSGRLAWVGVLFALAVLSRPTMGPVALALAALAALLRNDGRVPRTLTPARKRALLILGGLPVAGGALLLAYNAARFSGPLDFGSKYQFGGRDVRHLPYNELSNVGPALWGYLVVPLRVGLEFPYLHLPPPPLPRVSWPAGFIGEPTASVLWAVPFVLLSLVGVAVSAVRSRWGQPLGAPGRAIAVLLVIAAMPLLIGAYSIPGYTERYELDFVPCLVIAATLGWAVLVAGTRTPRRATAWRVIGTALVLWSVLVGVAISFSGYNDRLKMLNPTEFSRLERFFAPLPTLVTSVVGHPVISTINAPAGVLPVDVGYTTLGPGGSTATLTTDAPASVTIISPGRRDVQLRFVAQTVVKGRLVVAGALRGASVGATVRSGSAAAIPLALHRGLNVVSLTLGVPQGVVVPAGAPPVLQLVGLRLG